MNDDLMDASMLEALDQWNRTFEAIILEPITSSIIIHQS